MKPKNTHKPTPKTLFEFNFYMAFATIRNCYGVWLATDRSVFIPLVISPVKKHLIENLLTGNPSPELTPFLVMLDAWKALGTSATSIRLQTHKTPPMVRGFLQLKQQNELGTNIAEVGCEHSDLMVLSLLLNHPLQVDKASAEMLATEPKDINADDKEMAESIRRAMVILEDASELAALTKKED